VAVPSHVFVEMGAPGAPAHRGRDHLQTWGSTSCMTPAFFQQQGGSWARQRGLPPLTFDDYRRRTIVSPTAMVALAMSNVRPAETLRTTPSACVRAGCPGGIPDNASCSAYRLAAYNNRGEPPDGSEGDADDGAAIRRRFAGDVELGRVSAPPRCRGCCRAETGTAARVVGRGPRAEAAGDHGTRESTASIPLGPTRRCCATTTSAS
jgi:hypothetical protein